MAAVLEETKEARYARKKDRENARQAAQSRAGRDIGELPAVSRPDLRDACKTNLALFLKSYLPHSFPLPWCPDHLDVINAIQVSTLIGGLFAFAMPRGSGKTTICEGAALWAVAYAHRLFVALIGSTAKAAASMLDSIRVELETNELFQADFPEICWPILCLEGIPQRRLLYRGELIRMAFKQDRIILPTISGSPSSGVIIGTAGITGRLRGWKHKRADGTSLRPDYVLPDDPQTDESARSPGQCVTRERILAGAVLGLAGPGKKIAGVCPLTVIAANDVADNLLDRKKHPEWTGKRLKMVYAWPTNEKLWEEYAEIYREGLLENDTSAATEFYCERREAMDAGAVVAWPERFDAGEISALQNAWNLRIRDERAFMAEYQNDPMPDVLPDADEVTADQIAAKLNGLKRGMVPAAATHLTMFIDVQGAALFYLVAGWESGFAGHVVDYGTWPDQQKNYFTLRECRRTLLSETKAPGLEAAIYAGLERLTEATLGREWPSAGGANLRIGRCMVDANWGESTPVVRRFCRQSPHAAILLASHGKGIGAGGLPMDMWPDRKDQGEVRGQNWLVNRDNAGGKKAIYDTNYWKSFVASRLATPMGAKGCLALFGSAGNAHRMLADHLTAEFRVRTEGRGRTVDEWKVRPNRDNHWYDCLVGAAVAASMLGVTLEAHGAAATTKRKVVSMAELKAKAQMRRGTA